jgi:hypothetical protein
MVDILDRLSVSEDERFELAEVERLILELAQVEREADD